MGGHHSSDNKKWKKLLNIQYIYLLAFYFPDVFVGLFLFLFFVIFKFKRNISG